MKKSRIFIIFLTIWIFFQCSSALKKSQYGNVNCKTAFELIEKHKLDNYFVIIDFRTQKMYDESHIEGAICFDVNSPEVNDWLEKLNKEKIFLIYCNSGVRSAKALKKMEGMGFKKTYHMFEGIRKWKSEGFETK